MFSLICATGTYTIQEIVRSLNIENNLVLKVLSASSIADSANPNSKLSNPLSLFWICYFISFNSVSLFFSSCLVIFKILFFLIHISLLVSDLKTTAIVNKFEKSSNECFVVEVSKWVFHEMGHPKVCPKMHIQKHSSQKLVVVIINRD
ncbi:unnamed protein product [Coffea canephora]|uniref:Uncharacterized protein n=1 Tax=Coffea canephora TaxID=49390 RepID=A0A068UF34_COFCA|nr:unnamed protein product [Coffea canephora]